MNLYKYISSDVWTKVLKEKKLRFSPPCVFNDPFEMQPFYEPLSEDPAIQEHLNVPEMKGILEELFLEQYPSLPDEIKATVPSDFLTSYAGLISPFALQHSPTVLLNLPAPLVKVFMTDSMNTWACYLLPKSETLYSCGPTILTTIEAL